MFRHLISYSQFQVMLVFTNTNATYCWIGHAPLYSVTPWNSSVRLIAITSSATAFTEQVLHLYQIPGRGYKHWKVLSNNVSAKKARVEVALFTTCQGEKVLSSRIRIELYVGRHYTTYPRSIISHSLITAIRAAPQERIFRGGWTHLTQRPSTVVVFSPLFLLEGFPQG